MDTKIVKILGLVLGTIAICTIFKVLGVNAITAVLVKFAAVGLILVSLTLPALYAGLFYSNCIAQLSYTFILKRNPGLDFLPIGCSYRIYVYFKTILGKPGLGVFQLITGILNIVVTLIGVLYMQIKLGFYYNQPMHLIIAMIILTVTNLNVFAKHLAFSVILANYEHYRYYSNKRIFILTVLPSAVLFIYHVLSLVATNIILALPFTYMFFNVLQLFSFVATPIFMKHYVKDSCEQMRYRMMEENNYDPVNAYGQNLEYNDYIGN